MNAIIEQIRTISISIDETISSSTFPFFEQYLDATFDGDDLATAFQRACMDDCFVLVCSAFSNAYGIGDLKSINKLLRGGFIDPSGVNNDAIRTASRKGHADVVKRLLEDPRVDPSVDNNVAFRWASQNGHFEVVRCLINDGRVDKTSIQKAVLTASQYRYMDILEFILEIFEKWKR